jgi:hypothetical protein
MRFRWSVVAIVFGLLAGGSQAADPARVAAIKHWQALTRNDVEAAYQFLERNHPGPIPALGDTQFQRRLADGYRTALKRAGQVTGYDGYRATMQGFANSLGDQHIYFRQIFQPGSVDWAGLIAEKRGSRWIVADTDSQEEKLKNSEIVSCDGRSPDDLGRERLGAFIADWRIPAQQIITSRWLLIDDGNPFVKRPDHCVFRTAHGEMTAKLDWRSVSPGKLDPHIDAAAGFGEAGFGVKPFEGGTWIALEGFGQKASQVVADVRARASEIRRSPIIVIDLRGNPGGNSEYGDQLARILLGDDYVSAVFATPEAHCGTAWRASPENLKIRIESRSVADPTLGPDFLRSLDGVITQMKRALARGQPFSAPITCKMPSENQIRTLPPWPAKFKLVVVTDAACFSACLAVTDELRQLGAVQVGQSTNAGTRYHEVRETLLPSELGFLSTLQEVVMSEPPQYGPFEPKYVYDGNIADTAAVQHWVAATVPH